jgi:hypothetical protein
MTDPANQLVGYQVNFKHLEMGAFLFNHDIPSCRSTIAIPVHAFSDLYDGPVYEENRRGSDECPEYCLHQENLERCLARCECAFVREVLQILREWPKESPIAHDSPNRHS